MERWRGGEGAPPEYLNIDKHRQQPRQPTTTATTSRDKQRQQEEGANLAPPGWWSGEGGGVTLRITRGTKTGNKVLSLWKGGKRKWEKKKD